MTPTEKQVVNLALSQRLKELGVPQKSIFNWYKFRDGEEIKYRVDELLRTPSEASAFLVGELGEIISDLFNEWSQGWNDSGCYWHFRYGNRGAGYMMDGIGYSFSALDAETEADARALLLIHLIEQGIIKASDL